MNLSIQRLRLKKMNETASKCQVATVPACLLMNNVTLDVLQVQKEQARVKQSESHHHEKPSLTSFVLLLT